jgi:hypothetical protein|tara:strand:+ start:381 stop:512 length:132 start_codon:yes stop_codon:yes gene_type:complete
MVAQRLQAKDPVEHLVATQHLDQKQQQVVVDHMVMVVLVDLDQ